MRLLKAIGLIFACTCGLLPMLAQASVHHHRFARKSRYLTLSDAIVLALRFNPQVRQNKLQRVADRLALKDVEYDFQPQFSIGASQSYTYGGSEKISNLTSITPKASLKLPIGTTIDISAQAPVNNRSYKPDVTLAIEQPLLKGFGRAVVEADLENARDTFRISKLTAKNTLEETITQTIQAYTQVVKAKLTLQNDRTSLKQAERSLANTRLLVKTGKNPRSGIVRNEQQVAQDKVRIEKAKTDLFAARYNLVVLLGLNPNQRIRVSSHIKPWRLRIPDEKALERLGVANNLSYQTQLIQLNSTKRAVITAKNSALPELDLKLDHTFSQGGGEDIVTPPPLTVDKGSAENQTTVSLNFTMPIGDVPLKNAVTTSKIAVEQAEIALKEQRERLISTIRSQRTQLINARQAVYYAEQQYGFAKKTYHDTEILYKVGKKSAFELVSEQVSLREAQQTLINNRISYIDQLAEFDQTLGLSLNAWGVEFTY